MQNIIWVINMTIGLPRAMLYYRCKVLWETFFKEIGCDTITSAETNKQILQDGIRFSIDECCLPSKIYMGHVYSLIGKCDYILVPRIGSCDKRNDVCVKFNALYDIVKNTFRNASILDYNIDTYNGKNEKKAFLKMGKVLGNSYMKSLKAYKKAKKAESNDNNQKIALQNKILERTDRLKILIVSHPYNSYDKFIGYPITEYINQLGCISVFADATDKKESLARSTEISKSLYWIYNKELIGSIKCLENKINGIILLTAFPCGPDSLVNELIIRKTTNIPTINIILDELQGEAGMQTRIESFLDIIKERARLSS